MNYSVRESGEDDELVYGCVSLIVYGDDELQ